MSEETIKDDLEGLLVHPGWLRFTNHAREEWRDKLNEKVRAAANHTDDTLGLRQIQQLVVAQDAVERLLTWPTEQLLAIEQGEAKQKGSHLWSVSRRGGL